MIRISMLFLAIAACAVADATAQAAIAPAGPAAGTTADTAVAGPQGDAFAVAAALRNPELYVGMPVRVDGTVVRTARRQAAGAESRSLLLRVLSGDTLSVRGPDTLPMVGARIAVAGTLQVSSDGRLELAGGTEPLRIVVLESPEAAVEAETADGLGVAAESAGWCGSLPPILRTVGCALAGLPPVVLGAAGALLLGIVATAIFLRREPDDDVIPLIVDLAEQAAARPAGVDAARSWGERRPAGDGAPARGPAHRTAAPAAEQAKLAAGDVATEHDAGSGALRMSRVVPAEPARSPASAPGDEILQMLPGRLEVVDGDALGPEIRFFRLSSLEVPEITFGRIEGPQYRHIRLDAPTVSRMHARLRFAGRRWTILNLSDTNPVTVNERSLDVADQELVLADGDRIRIGDFVFRFRDDRS